MSKHNRERRARRRQQKRSLQSELARKLTPAELSALAKRSALYKLFARNQKVRRSA